MSGSPPATPISTPSGRLAAVLQLSQGDVAVVVIFSLLAVAAAGYALRREWTARRGILWAGKAPFEAHWPLSSPAVACMLLLVGVDWQAGPSSIVQYATSVGVSAAAPYLLLPLVLAGVAWVVWPTLRRVGAADVPGYLGIRFDPLFAMYATGVSVLVLLIGTMALLVSGATWLTPAMNWTPASSVSLLVCLGTLLAMLSPTQVTLANLALVLASGLLIAGTLLG
ncbi:unnamed protein product, partial [Symbiodinium sp. KB8]